MEEKELLAAAAAATPHAQSRVLFTVFAKRSSEVVGELEEALRDLVHTYDPAVWENRFVIGGAVELLIAAAMRAVNLDVDNVGGKSTEGDFDVYASRLRQRVSVKSTFRLKENTVRLINTMGPNEAKTWTKPTIFLVPDLGMVYGDPGFRDLALAVKRTGDALVIPTAAIRGHAATRPQFRIAMEVPVNPRTGYRVASRDVARSIVQGHRFQRVGAWLRPEPSKRYLEEIRGHIEGFAKLRADGLITEEEFAAAKQRVLESPDRSVLTGGTED